MAKTVRRFHANIMRITHQFVKEDKMKKQAPEMPKMKWLSKGQPDYKHLEEDDKQKSSVHRKNVNQAVPPVPKMRWNRDGSPDWSHL